MKGISVTPGQIGLVLIAVLILVAGIVASSIKLQQERKDYEAQIDQICKAYSQVAYDAEPFPPVHVSCSDDGRPKTVLIQRHMKDGTVNAFIVVRGSEPIPMTLPLVQ